VLVAFCTPRPGVVLPAASALRAHLATLLPSPLIPARFAPAERLPRLPNGKVDRQALRTAPLPAAPTRAVNPGSPVPPDAVHAGLQAIWQALLNRDRVGLDDDFFLLGGHSLLATRLVARIRDRFGVELPLIRVFEAPTIRGLAAYLVPAASG
jgi:acyl carrier protein